jgi:hypothetical protein
MQGVSFLCVSLEVLKTTTTTNTNIYHPNMVNNKSEVYGQLTRLDPYRSKRDITDKKHTRRENKKKGLRMGFCSCLRDMGITHVNAHTGWRRQLSTS